MGIIKQDKSIFNLFKKKDKVEQTKSGENEKESYVFGTIIFWLFSLGIMGYIDYVLYNFFPTQNFISSNGGKSIFIVFNVIVLSFAIVSQIYLIKSRKDKLDEDNKSEDEETDDESEDEDNPYMYLRRGVVL